MDGYDTDPCLSIDETQLAFTRAISTAANSADVLIAGASGGPLSWSGATGGPFAIPGRDDHNPKLSADAGLMWLAVNPAGIQADIRAWSRPDPGGQMWTDVSATETNGLNTSDDERPGTPTPDRDHMIIHRNLGAGQFLVEYQRTGAAGPWIEVPGTLGVVNAIGNALNAHFFAGGRRMVFAAVVAGQVDLYLAERSALGVAFDTPVAIAEVNSATAHDSDPWLSADGCRVWFARSSGTTPVATWGIYYAERAPL